MLREAMEKRPESRTGYRNHYASVSSADRAAHRAHSAEHACLGRIRSSRPGAFDMGTIRQSPAATVRGAAGRDTFTRRRVQTLSSSCQLWLRCTRCRYESVGLFRPVIPLSRFSTLIFLAFFPLTPGRPTPPVLLARPTTVTFSPLANSRLRVCVLVFVRVLARLPTSPYSFPCSLRCHRDSKL
ncbi:hypothetical protein MRX96_029979 [Rhipicephalus microplus]